MDLVPTGAPARYRLTAGGTCGNVSVILRYLGNSVTPVIAVGSDRRGDRLRAVLLARGLDTSAIVTLPGRETPAVVLDLVSNARGEHRFLFACPSCRSPFPRSSRVTLAMAAAVNGKLAQSQSLFFDRAAPGSLRLAANAGAAALLVMFEPNHIHSSAGSTTALN